MGYQTHRGSSLIHIRGDRVLSMLAAFNYALDEDLSTTENLIECLIDIDWECVSQGASTLSFTHDPEEAIDWQAFITMAPFLEDGSFFEERPDDYVEDLQGNSCPGVMQAIVEEGVLHCRLYALVETASGQRVRQLVQVLDPLLF